MSDIVEIDAHRNRAQAAYDKLPLSGPVGEWCEMYGEDLLDSCTKLLAALKQRTELIDAAAKHWLESCRTTNPPIPWEGAIDGAMEAACREIERLRAENAKLSSQLEQSHKLGRTGRYPCTPEHTWSEWLDDRHKRVAELEAELLAAKDAADVREGDTLVGEITKYVEERHELARQNAKLRDAVTWRPIESAPRDGREVSVWCPSDNPGDNGGYVVPGAWWGSVLSFDEEGREIARYCWRCHGDEGVRWAHRPTHWLPLPEAPR